MTLIAVIATALIPLALIYVIVCVAQPYHTCSRCSGAGKRKALVRVKECTRCLGTGLRLRLGRQVWNRIQHTRSGR